MQTKVKNITDLIADMTEMYNQARDNKVSFKDAQKCSNVANTLLRATATKLKYNELRELDEPIAFLENEKSK